MDLLPGLREMRMGDEVVGDGAALLEDTDKADFTSNSEDEEGSYAAIFSDNEE